MNVLKKSATYAIFIKRSLMKKFLLLFSFCLYPFFSQAQLISFEPIATYTVDELYTLMAEQGVPTAVLTPLYEVTYYKVIYNTPYLHEDSLVQASGGLAIPNNVACDLPLACYGHGTQTRRDRAASSMNGGQWEVGLLFASTGYTVALPDYLGLGEDADPKVTIHPYTHAFSQSRTSVNMMRATRQIAQEIEIGLNGQIFLFGYSHGGFTAVATHRYIEQSFDSEFQITASAPMSGVYDMEDVQIELMSSEEVYPTPGYLPYILLAYQSIYGNLFEEPSEFLVAPYDTLLPPLFYEGETSIGTINTLCEPVPKDMIPDSAFNAFQTNPAHPLRLDLLENHMLDWAPQAPIKLFYCNGDDQVTYLNSERAYDSWTANGAMNVEKQDFGSFDHNGCALFCFLGGKNYFDSFADLCPPPPVGIEAASASNSIQIYPNPTNNRLHIQTDLVNYELTIYSLTGQLVLQQSNVSNIDLTAITEGSYVYQLTDGVSVVKRDKLVVIK